jgi:hypothetical protein
MAMRLKTMTGMTTPIAIFVPVDKPLTEIDGEGPLVLPWLEVDADVDAPTAVDIDVDAIVTTGEGAEVAAAVKSGFLYLTRITEAYSEAVDG